LRDFGYTLPSALADLIDNSIAAQAKTVWVTVEPATAEPRIAVVDNGLGMTEERLVEAMRMGTLGPLSARSTTDLGRFGLGMKTASLSQGRCVTVISKRGRTTTVRRWDLDHVRRTQEWRLLPTPGRAATDYCRQVEKLQHGTAIVIEQLDRASFMRVDPASRGTHLASALESVRDHLGMVFHRFIEEDGLEIRLGEGTIRAWDPYLIGLSTRLASEKLRLPSHRGEFEVAPFILPHHSRLTDDLYEQGAGPLGWNAHQGFYIYRCRRLIVPGTWLNLNLKREEEYKLARIRVDLPNTMDQEWQLNVMKSHVSAPASLRDDFRRIASDVRRQASDVYRVRGERQVPAGSRQEQFVWRRESVRTGVRYRVDRTHPVMRALLHAGCTHEAILQSALTLIEHTLPIAAILQEPRRAIDGSAGTDAPLAIDLLVDMMLHAEQFFIRTGKSTTESRNLVLLSEPFVRFRDAIVERLRERTAAPKPENRK
jgi:hypothetical protein